METNTGFGPAGAIDRPAVIAAAGPELAALQTELRTLVRRLKTIAGFGFVIPVAFFASIFVLPGAGGWIFIAFIAAGAGVVVMLMRAAKRIYAARSKLFEAAAPALGLAFERRPAPPVDFALFDGTYYASLLKYCRVQDMLSGTRNGRAFQIFDAALTGRSRGPDGAWRSGKPPKWLEGVAFATVRMVAIETPGRWTARTAVLRDEGVANRLYQPKGMERVRLVDPKFEKLFEVFSTDQIEARALLHPAFMERLMTLEDLFLQKATRHDEDAPPAPVAVFADGRFLLAMPPMPGLQPSSDANRMVKETEVTFDLLLNELDAVMGVVDALAGPEPAAS